MFGKGILKGLGVTAKEAVSPRLTEKYPEEKPQLPARWRGGTFALDRRLVLAVAFVQWPARTRLYGRSLIRMRTIKNSARNL